MNYNNPNQDMFTEISIATIVILSIGLFIGFIYNLINN